MEAQREMTLAELRSEWVRRRDEWHRLTVLVDGAKLVAEFLADLDQLDASAEQLLTLVEAAEESGFSADHLGRLVRSGSLPNAGRPNAPRIRRRDLPRKPLPASTSDAIVRSDRRRIAASVLTLNERRQDG